jgi:hypothetical protein
LVVKKLFFSGFFRVLKTAVFIKSAGGGIGAQVIKRIILTGEPKKP